MTSTNLRSFTKGVIWEGLGLLILYLLTHSLQISAFYVTLRIIMYWGYERIWKKIKWGKIKKK